jgi:hypothetical protein
MPGEDWRSPDPYRRLQTADAPTFAGEFMVRNPEFQDDVRRPPNPEGGGPEPSTSSYETKDDSFERRWGCELGPELLSYPPAPRWTLAALPSKLLLIETPPKLSQAAPALDLARIASGPLGFPALEIDQHDNDAAAAYSVVIPLDHLIDVRLAALRQLAAVLLGRRPGPDPLALTRARRTRLIQALRALDGRMAGAPYRAIAQALFGNRALPERAWKTHDLRDRTIRLVRYGEALMRGGYRRLLLHPYRGKL